MLSRDVKGHVREFKKIIENFGHLSLSEYPSNVDYYGVVLHGLLRPYSIVKTELYRRYDGGDYSD